MELHVVANTVGGYAREDEASANVLGAYTNPALANQVKAHWGSSATVRTVKVDAIPVGIQNTARELGVLLELPDVDAKLGRAHSAHQKATPGKWSWNCAGEILAIVDGQEAVIGSFNGCEADAAAACKLHNSAVALFERAGVPEVRS